VSKYIRIDKGQGVRVTLTVNGWALLGLAAGYFSSDMHVHGAKLKDLLEHIPRAPEGRGWSRGRGKKRHYHVPASKIEALKHLMKLTTNLSAGFLEAPQSNIGGALSELERLSVVDLLAATAGD
jgi:hypothetical protein